MKNGRYDPLEHRNSSPYLSKQNSKSDQKMESSLTDFIGGEYARNVFYDCCLKRYERLTLFYFRPVRSGFMFGGGNTSGCLDNVDIDHECLSNVRTHVLEDALILEILDYISGSFNINLDIRFNLILILFVFKR